MKSFYRNLIEDPLALSITVAIMTTIFNWMWRIAPKWFKSWSEKRKDRRRRQYHTVIDGEKFVEWRDRVLKHMYGEKYFTYEFGCEFPVYALECAENIPYKFRGFYDKNDIPFQSYNIKGGELAENSLDNQKFVYPSKLKIKKFMKRLVPLKQPRLLGYILDRYDMTPDGKITHVYPKLGRYEQTVHSSLILEYEIYEAYKKCKGAIIPGDDIWRYFPLRSCIHGKGSDKSMVEEVLFSGKNRYSLLSVQGFIIFWDPKEGDNGEYVTLIAQRSNNVTAKVGYYQFLPAGGFEMYDCEDARKVDVIKANYSLRKAFFREYLEEVFNQEEFIQVLRGRHERLPQIMNDPKTEYITDLIESGQAHFELMGSAVDLVNLRHDLSFILRIDDDNYHRNIFSFNDEFEIRNMIRQRIPLKELEERFCGEYKICQASVGLYHMAKKSRLYRELADNGFNKLPASRVTKGGNKK
jgi:hypothetical protein